MAGLADILSQAAGSDTPPDETTTPAPIPTAPAALGDILTQAAQGNYTPAAPPAPEEHLAPLEGTTVVPAKTTPTTRYGRFTIPEHTEPERYQWQPEDIANKIGNEATLGTGKYLAAGLGAASRWVQGEDPNFSGQLSDIRQSIHRGEAELGPEAPLVDYGVPLAEAAVMGPLTAGERVAAEALPAAETAIGRVWQAGKNFVKPLLKNAGVGAGVGAVSGAANTEGPNWMDYVYGAERGATVGAVLGAGIPAVIKGVSALGSAAKGLLGSGNKEWANKAILEALQADGVSEADANRKLAAWVNAGSKPETVLDLGGDAMRRLGRVVYTQGGKGASGLQDFLEGRASGRVDRIMGDVGEAAGTPERNVVYEQPRLEAEAQQATAGAQTAAQQGFQDVAGRSAGTRTVGQEAGTTIRSALDAERQRLQQAREQVGARDYGTVERSPITVDTDPVREVVAQKLLDHEGTPIGKAVAQANSTLNLDSGMRKTTMPQMQGSLQAIRDQQAGLFQSGQRSAGHHVREVGDALEAQINAADTSLQQANAAYRTASTPLAPFNDPTMGHAADILAQDQYRTGYVMPDEAVPARYFNPGKNASSDMQEFRQLAGNNPDAVRAMRSYIADQAQRASQGPNGTFDPQAFGKWVAQHQDALRQFPQIAQDLTSWAQAVTAAGNAATGSQPALMLRAITGGRDFLKTDPEQIRAMLQAMSPAEQEMFRQGAMRALRDTMGGGKGATAVTQPFSGKPTGENLRNRVAAVFGNEENYQRFAQNAAREAAMQRTENVVLSGSQTANKQQDVEGIDKGAMAQAAFDSVVTRSPWPILSQLSGFGKRIFQASRGFTRGRTAEISKALQQPLDPSMIRDLQAEGARAAAPLLSGPARGAAGLAGAAGPAVAAPGTPGQRGLPGFAAGGRVGYAGGGLAGETLVGPDDTPPADAGVPVQYRDKVGQAQANTFWDQAGPQGIPAAISDFGLRQQAADQAIKRVFQARQKGIEPSPEDQEAAFNGPLQGFALGLSGPIGAAGKAGEGLAAGLTHDTGALHGQAPEPAPLAAPAGGAPEAYQGPVSGGRGELPGSAGGVGPSDRPASSAPTPLEGLPSKVKIHNDRELPDWMGGQREFEAGPNPVARQVAANYMAKTGLDTQQPTKYLQVDPERGARIAQAFDEMKHDPNDPLVKAAYDAMAKETLAQWRQIKKTGLKTEFIKPGDPDPYHASPRLAAEDVKRNNHLYVFPTDSGYGTTGITPEAIAENPLLAATNEKVGGQPARMNDIFRIVHDYFGHIKEGVGFRAEGEENAWNSHARMYSPLARLAMTSETRGQNSWVNWGPHGEANRGASSPDTVYAEQKIGVLPDWTMSEGAEGVAPVNTADMRKMLAGPRYPAADDPGNIGSAKQLYHGTYSLPEGLDPGTGVRRAKGDFENFKTRPGDVGVHLGTPGQANDRLDYLALNRPMEGQNIRPVLADIKNPLRLDDLGSWDKSNVTNALERQFPELKSRGVMSMPQIRQFIRGKGYDGVVYKNTGELAGQVEKIKAENALLAKAQREARSTTGLTAGANFHQELQKHPSYQAYSQARAARAAWMEKNAEDSYIALKPDQIRTGVGARGPRSAEDVMAENVGLPKGDKIRDALESAKAAVANEPDTGLFDLRRDTLAETPNVQQRELPRYEPHHGVSERMNEMMNRDDVREQMLQGIGAGVKQGSAGWYNTDQLRQAFQRELGDHGDAAYKRFLDYVSGASPRSNVLENIRNASFQHYLEAQGHHPNDVNPFPYPYGHIAQNLHRMNAAKIRGGGYNLFDNPKPPSFAANLAGNWRPGTMDAHAMRAVGMLSQDPRFLASSLRLPLGKDLAGTEQYQNVYPKRMFERGEIDMPKALATPGYWSNQPNPNEYKALEHYFRGLGREYELDTAPTQAAAWTGHGKMTGLGTEPLPFMALFDKVLNRTAYARGEEPKETLRRFIRGEAPLYEEGGSVHENGLASGGRAVARAFHEVYHNTPKIVTHTAEKFGAKDAQKQRVAIALSKARKAGADV